MIIEALLDFLLSLIENIMWVYGAVWPTPPAWLVTGFNQLNQVVGWSYQLEHWVNVDLAITIAGAVVATWVVVMAIQLVRVIASYLTLGGGAT